MTVYKSRSPSYQSKKVKIEKGKKIVMIAVARHVASRQSVRVLDNLFWGHQR